MATPSAPSTAAETPAGGRSRLAGLGRALRPAVLPAILGLALALRLVNLVRRPLWYDETFTVWIAGHGPEEIWGADTMPPLYYLFMSLWTLGGEGEVWLRLSSVLFSLAGVAVAWRIGLEQGGRTLAALLALLLALSPFDVLYAQELRMYSLLNLGGLLALLGFFRLLRAPDEAARPLGLKHLLRGPAGRALWGWRLYLLGSLLALYTHNLGGLVPLSASLAAAAVWWRRPDRRPLLRNWLKVNGLALVVWALYWPWLAQQAATILGGFWIRQPGLTELLEGLFFLHGGQPWVLNALEAAGAAFLLALMLLGGWSLRRSPLLPALLLLALVPVAVELAVGLVRPVFGIRTLIWTAICGLLLAACGLRTLLRRWRWVGLAAALCLFAMQAVVVVKTSRAFDKPDWRGLAERLQPAVRSGDLVLLVPWYEEVSLDYYGRRLAAAGRPLAEFRLLRLEKGRLVPPPADAERLWLLHSDWFGPLRDDRLAALAAAFPCFEPRERFEVRSLSAQLYAVGADACGRAGEGE